MKRKTIIVCVLVAIVSVIAFFIFGIFAIAPSGHGSIKGYVYNVDDTTLQRAIWRVIRNDSNIICSIHKEYYNDSTNYITIDIKKASGGTYNYIFRYYGDDKYRKVTGSSEIFICYVYNDKRQGGRDSDKDFSTYKGLREDIVGLFEKEFIYKLDGELGKNHVDD